MESKRMIFFVFCLSTSLLLITGACHAVVIDDRAGGAIYWGGKYVNIKANAYGDAIGTRSAVDQMEVIMNNDIMTVKITGPYFFNYAHNIKRTRDAPPGDLFISSKGWKVTGSPPYSNDIFEASEGWDYVVSLENKKVHTLKFSDIVMTSRLPYTTRYRAHQAWKGGYGETLDDAEIILADTGLTFIFSVRNMRLNSEIGLHWTMKCGNDIIEGSGLIPPIAMTPHVPPAAPEGGTSTLHDVIVTGETAKLELPGGPIYTSSSAASVQSAFPSAATAASGGSFGGPIVAGTFVPIVVVLRSRDDDSSTPVMAQGGHVAPSESDTGHVAPFETVTGQAVPESVPELPAALLLLGGLSGILVGRRSVKWVTRHAAFTHSNDSHPVRHG
jgi:hypothetical protein